MLEVERHINKDLHKALHLEKSQRLRGKRLNLLGEEAGGPVFFSPSKVQKVREIQQQKEADKQLKRDHQAEKKIQQAANRAEKEQEKAERATLCCTICRHRSRIGHEPGPVRTRFGPGPVPGRHPVLGGGIGGLRQLGAELAH